MSGTKQEFPNRVGVGLCKEDFTIEEKVLAGFTDLFDAEKYIKTRIDDDLFSYPKIYYIDVQAQDGRSALAERYIYDSKKNEFIEGKEVLTGKSDIYITGYEVYADYEDEEGNYDYTERTVCISGKAADMMKQEYLEEGASGVSIEDKEDIGIKENF